ncbi:hypothetical protein HMPREF9332_01062 [Alloprevotella rava F0323]|uniref:Superoxide dismutase n=1 Tax=Alloprevotella rava F0323 TaxID=679199 RepID=G5GBW1_9BACT|nr:superoxide dismutase [Alloprevotella rava]EHG23015.1 hypothetical protein HMPREF9332_01062 [Alloprevotella rava F0323]
MKYEMPKLNYPLDGLKPRISEDTMKFHYGKHLQAYTDNLNKLIKGTEFEDKSLEEIVRTANGAIYNNAAQVWNHTFFFETLSPTAKPISGTLKAKLIATYGSIDNFKNQLMTKATGLFGSGWIWLTYNERNQLNIEATTNAGNPLQNNVTPLMTIDVWEHAYYLDYQNRRADFCEAVWDLTDWYLVEERMEKNLFNIYY